MIDTLCKQAVKESSAVGYFYFDFAAKEEQSPVVVLGSVLEQVVRELDEVPERIVNAFQGREEVIGNQRITVSEIVEFLKDISSSRCVFICIDALDECQAGHRVKLLDSLNQILTESPGARIYLTGRPHIRTEVEEYLAGRLASTSLLPAKDDITAFVRAKLREGTMQDTVDPRLEEDIIQDIITTFSRAGFAEKLREGAMQNVTGLSYEEEMIQKISEKISDM